MLQWVDSILYLRDLTYLPFANKCNYLFTWNFFMKQLAFLTNFDTPSMENIAQISSHFFQLN